MAPIPPLTPTLPESTGARIRPLTRSEVSDDAIRQSNASLIFVKLRKMIASDTQPTETIMGAIAVAAHSLTGATGAAVAMPRESQVVCVGRSGDTAPELGVRLNVDSGISGECLRTGVTMRCDDASRDLHVNAGVCRELGLQSIAVVPLRGQHSRVGVLEVFSSESYAFDDDKIAVLERLAGLAEAAWARGVVTDISSSEDALATTELAPVLESPALEAPAEQAAVDPSPVIPAEVPLAQMREVFATAPPETALPRRKVIFLALVAAAVLVFALLAVYGWKAWYRSSVTSGIHQPAGVSTSTDNPNAAGSTATPDFVRPSSRPAGASAKPSAEIPDTVVRRRLRSARRSGGSANGGTGSRSASNNEELPQIAASNGVSADLGSALAASPALPRLGVPVSQGTSGGVLVYKVQPVYPAEARRMHVQGNVVIDATVTAEGRVDEAKLVSGDPMLATAALDAVRRWRYTPYALNGKPIPKETRITVSFISGQ
jgi:TonB family protein